MPQIHAPPNAVEGHDPVRRALNDSKVVGALQSAARRELKIAKPYLSYAALENEGEEVASAAIFKALEKSSSFDPTFGKSVTVWIIGYIKNIVRKHDRLACNTGGGGNSANRADPSPSVQDKLIRDSETELVSKALAKLDPAERALAQRRYFQDENAKDIAAETGIEQGTVRVNLHRIRKKLFDLLSPSIRGGQS